MMDCYTYSLTSSLMENKQLSRQKFFLLFFFPVILKVIFIM